MLTCLPRGICSWDFDLYDGHTPAGAATFNLWTEQGTISIRGQCFDVVKHGPASGTWTLESGGLVHAQAIKPSALHRRFEITSGTARLEAVAESFVGRAFLLRQDDRHVGTIAPAHAFTRRATIDCAPGVPELHQVFAFWLAVLTWRRAANNAAAG